MSSDATTPARRRPGQKGDSGARLERGKRAWKRPAFRIAGVALLLLLPACAQFLYVVPDSAGHVAWVRSLVWDRDVDFTNDFARLGMIEREGDIAFGAPTARGRPGNPFGLGSALLWMPGVVAAAGVARLAAATGAGVATDGFGTATLLAVHLGSWTCAFACLALVAATLREALPAAGDAARRGALAAVALGTPFLAYVLELPSYSHACSAFAVALVLWLGVRWRRGWSARRAVAMGAAVGLAALVRPQEAAFLVLPPLLGRWGGGLRPRRDAALLCGYVATAAVVFLPQLLAWKAIYGSLLQVPQGEHFLRFAPVRLASVLLGSRHGLLVWSPVVALALWGLLRLARDRATRGLAVAALVAFGLEWVANALPVDWWAGWSFGARRFVDCVPLFALGLAAFAARGRAARAAIAAAVGAGLVVWLRVASRDLSGEADPGWGALWGAGFWHFLPRVPAALAQVLATPWTALQVIRRPQSTPADFQVDPPGFLVLLYGMWALGAAAVVWRFARRRVPAAAAQAAAQAASRRGE